MNWEAIATLRLSSLATLHGIDGARRSKDRRIKETSLSYNELAFVTLEVSALSSEACL